MPGKPVRREKGQVLILVLILFTLCAFLIKPLLDYSSVGFKSGRVYENKADELYAADAGVEDAVWQIKYDHLDTLFTSPPYQPYEYALSWSYTTPELVNSRNANVTIQNIWVPDVPVPAEAQARTIVQNAKLIVTGSIPAPASYRIKITYYPGAGENLTIQTIGIWLPPGFTYVNGSSNLEVPGETYHSVPVKSPHAGGQFVTWSFDSVRFIHFPGVNPGASPMTSEVTFQFDSTQSGLEPDAVAWITTGGVADIPFAWDVDTKIYRITSTVDGTTVENYIAKNEARELSSGFTGDYKAAGNSLMVDTDHDGYYRETLLSSSNATVNDIPADATVKAAYLYWSARRQAIFLDNCSNFNNWSHGTSWTENNRFIGHYSGSGDPPRVLTKSNAVNLSSYASGTVAVSWNHSVTGPLNTNDGLDYSFSADGGTTWSSNFSAFRGPGVPSPTFSTIIPDAYLSANFKIRFYLVGFSGADQYYYMDNIIIMSADQSVVFKIDGQQVYYSANGSPMQGAQELTASRLQILPNYTGTNLDGSSYVGFKDVTALVKAFTAKAPDPAINHPGNAVYTVGNVSGDTGSQLSYAGWSLIIIYSSAETRGHSLYLYDSFMHSNGNMDIDFDRDGVPGGTISGFIVPDQIAGEVDAAKITAFIAEGDVTYPGDFIAFNAPETYRTHSLDIPNAYKLWDGTTTSGNNVTNPNNVWNSKSVGFTADGVDIDTFHVTWASGLLLAGDTSARIDITTQTDEWNLVYIIVSFRSEASTRGALSYIIRN